MTDYTDLITSEHSDKPKFMATVGAVTGAVANITALINSIPAAFDLDNAVGAQLDIDGLWIGQDRAIDGVLEVQFFGFEDNPVAMPFGEETNPSIGGRFYEEYESFTSTSILKDVEYKTVLRAKIVKNQAKGTSADLARSIGFIFNTSASIVDNGDMTISITLGRPITTTERALVDNLDILPRPAGVDILEIA